MIYDYKCLSCPNKFQKDVPMKSRNRRAKCTKCGSKKTRRIIHAPSVIYKGDGWGKDK